MLQALSTSRHYRCSIYPRWPCLDSHTASNGQTAAANESDERSNHLGGSALREVMTGWTSHVHACIVLRNLKTSSA